MDEKKLRAELLEWVAEVIMAYRHHKEGRFVSTYFMLKALDRILAKAFGREPYL